MEVKKNHATSKRKMLFSNNKQWIKKLFYYTKLIYFFFIRKQLTDNKQFAVIVYFQLHIVKQSVINSKMCATTTIKTPLQASGTIWRTHVREL